MSFLKRRCTHISLLLIALLYTLPCAVFGNTAWDFELPLPQNDPLWEEIGSLWRQHCTGNTLDNIIIRLKALEKTYPGRVEPLLWLGKAYLMKGVWNLGKNKEAYLKKAIDYALSARKIDSENLSAFRILVSCLPNFGNLEYAMANHGEWIEKAKPLPTGRALPAITRGRDWQAAFHAWDLRSDIEQAKKAVNLFKARADADKQDSDAQIWTCRGFYYLGYYYMAEQEERISLSYFKEGVKYGEQALKILPDSVPANYWYAINYGRIIQDMSLFNKALKFKPLLDHTIYCARENPLYFYSGPVLVMGTTITRGGWIVEKVMKRLGVNLEKVLNGLEMAEALYPDYLYIPYCKAEILSYIDRKDEAKTILEAVLARDVDRSRYHAAENRIVIKLSKLLIKQIAPKPMEDRGDQ